MVFILQQLTAFLDILIGCLYKQNCSISYTFKIVENTYCQGPNPAPVLLILAAGYEK